MRYQYSEEQIIDPKLRYRCRHIFTDGHRCGSPALRAQHLCYYHRSSRELPNTSSTARSAEAVHFPMPAIDDRSGIQLAIHHVLARLATNDIDAKRAGLMLYGLQIASANLPRQLRPTAHPAHAEAALEPLIEDYTHCPHLGPLAPLELLPEPELAITPEPSTTTARHPESEANPNAHTTNTARRPERSEAHPKDPEILRSSQTPETLPPSAPAHAQGHLPTQPPTNFVISTEALSPSKGEAEKPASAPAQTQGHLPTQPPENSVISTEALSPSKGEAEEPASAPAQVQGHLPTQPPKNSVISTEALSPSKGEVGKPASAPAQAQEHLTPTEDLTLDPAFWDPAIWQTPALNYKGHDPHPPMAP